MVNIRKLMVGDWVKTNPNCVKIECGIESNTAMVSEIGFSNSEGMYVSFAGIKGRYYDNEIEPIPLTEEILAKNGFKKVEKDLFHLGQSSIGVDTWLGIDNNVIYVDALYHDGEIAFCKCEYVHELQHALNLCEIKKIIKL